MVRSIALLLSVTLAFPIAASDTAPKDPDVRRGVVLVDDGEYDSAILLLDAAARRLAASPGNAAELSQAYLYLGIAYLGKGQEAAARARFREAIGQIKSLTLSADKYPPKVINTFEAAKEEVAGATPGAGPAPVKTPAKKGGSKALLIGLSAVAVGGGAVAAGGGSSPKAAATPAETRQTLPFSGTVAYQEFYTAVASRPGILEARVQWQNGQVNISIECHEKAPPYTGCGGVYNRTTNTSGVYTVNVTQKEYVIMVNNFGNPNPEPFTLTILVP